MLEKLHLKKHAWLTGVSAFGLAGTGGLFNAFEVKGKRERTDAILIRLGLRHLRMPLPAEDVKPTSFPLLIIYCSHWTMGFVDVFSNIGHPWNGQFHGCELSLPGGSNPWRTAHSRFCTWWWWGHPSSFALGEE